MEITIQGRDAVCYGDPEAFASEMIQLINKKEYRLDLKLF